MALPAEKKERAEAEAFDVILDANGFTRENVCKKIPNITRIEIFLVPYHEMLALDRFVNMKHLEIIDQGITVIKGLANCPQLETLFLPDNAIRAISGLDLVPRLKELNLNGNQIERLSSLDRCTELQVLMVCNNRLTSIDGLDKNAALRRLWLAGNLIETVAEYAIRLPVLWVVLTLFFRFFSSPAHGCLDADVWQLLGCPAATVRAEFVRQSAGHL